MFAKVPEGILKWENPRTSNSSASEPTSKDEGSIEAEYDSCAWVDLFAGCRIDVCNKHISDISLLFNSNSMSQCPESQELLAKHITTCIHGNDKKRDESGESNKRGRRWQKKLWEFYTTAICACQCAGVSKGEWPHSVLVGSQNKCLKLISQSSDCSCWSETAMKALSDQSVTCNFGSLFLPLSLCEAEEFQFFWFWPPQRWKSAAVGLLKLFYSLLQTLLSACSDMCACSASKVLTFSLRFHSKKLKT